MTDIVERIRRLHFVHVPGTSQLMEEAAAEIERLRNFGACPHVRGTVTQFCSLNFTLTDEEREAIKLATDFLEDEFYGCSDKCKAEHEAVATLRNLLERLA